MGRLAAYLGPKTRIDSLIEDGSYPLAEQTADLPDGFGLGWYPDDGDPAPVRLISKHPLHAADDLIDVPRRYAASCILAHISKLGRPAELGELQPFKVGAHLFAVDGELDRFADVFLRPLRERLSNDRYAALRSQSMAELLFATWADALGDQRGGDAMANALESLVATVQEVGGPARAAASFSVVVTDGHSLITLRTSLGQKPPPLYTLVAEPGAPVPVSGRVVASEPLFPGAWTALDPNSLVIFTVEPHTTEIEAHTSLDVALI